MLFEPRRPVLTTGAPSLATGWRRSRGDGGTFRSIGGMGKPPSERLGAPVLIDVRVQADILRLHAEGASLRQIAAALNASGAKPARGGMRWYASTIKSVIDRCEAGNVAA